MLLVGVQAAPQQGWDLPELAYRCSHAGPNQSSRSWGTAVPVLSCHRKARGQGCHIGHCSSSLGWEGARMSCGTSPRSRWLWLPCSLCPLCAPSSCRDGIIGIPACSPRVCWWESCLGIALSLFKPTEAVCLHTPCADKLQKSLLFR